jgi:hypothetical protein
VTDVARVDAPVAQPEPSEAIAWVLSNWVTVVAGILILASLCLKGVVLDRAFFRVDDYFLIDRSLSNHFTWHFLSSSYDDHLWPGAYALIWLLSRLSLYDWTLASIVNMVLLAAASLAMFRLLRTLFGSRPAILIPLAVYLFSPVMVSGLSFWSTAIRWLPTQLALCMAINAHVTYVRTGRLRHAVHAIAWIVFGLAFDELNALIPLLLFGLTSGFFAAGPWGRAAAETLRRYWKAWAAYAVIAVAYGLLYLNQLPASIRQPGKPGQFSNVLTVLSLLGRVTFIPTTLGGPWHWNSIGDWAFAAESPPLTQLSWSVAALVVVVSLWYRRHALRAWIILVAWVFLTVGIPLVVGRVGLVLDLQVLGTDVHYLADSLPVLAVCIALGFWPLAGEENAYRAAPPPRLRQAGTIALVGVYLAGSLWSYASYEKVTSSVARKSYLATARAAVAAAPAGVVIVNEPVPPFIEPVAWFPTSAWTATVLGPLVPSALNAHWTDAPSGVYTNLMIFDDLGRLWSAPGIVGDTVHPDTAHNGCWRVGTRTVTIPLGGKLFHWGWEMSMNYVGPAATMAVQFGGTSHDVQLPAGMHTVWVPATGAGADVQVQLLSGGPRVCVSSLSIGNMAPYILSQPMPAVPVPG